MYLKSDLKEGTDSALLISSGRSWKSWVALVAKARLDLSRCLKTARKALTEELKAADGLLWG